MKFLGVQEIKTKTTIHIHNELEAEFMDTVKIYQSLHYVYVALIDIAVAYCLSAVLEHHFLLHA